MTPPAFIGRYAIKRSLGSGGFATVWLGFDERLDDHVAIKVLAENWAQRLDVRDRFVHEARVLRRARSPHVVQVFDIDELPDGRPYFVMTYADGGSLSDRLEHGPLPAETALGYGAVIAAGAQDLHDSGVMHRDIKPSNVLFRSSSEVLIADLGLARDLDRGSRLTMTAGTPGYMAPEQADGDATIDHRVDVYAIGATVYRALTGHTPVLGAVTPVGQVRPDLPPGADAVLMRALATHPGDRWSTAGELAEELRRVANGQAGNEAVAPPTRSRTRHWWIAAVVAVLAISATVAGVLIAANPGDRPAGALAPAAISASSSSAAPVPSPAGSTSATATPSSPPAATTSGPAAPPVTASQPPPSPSTPPATTPKLPRQEAPDSKPPATCTNPRTMCFYPLENFYGTPEVHPLDWSADGTQCRNTAKPFKSVYNHGDQSQRIFAGASCFGPLSSRGGVVEGGSGWRYVDGAAFQHT
ncbi:serine/threonine-protein kinase [Amycolatopsis sp. lyj-84]|uniref:serine/threonine-protein kinase n=1 Tax=Amycolatopsis sp. lyj-84 TaxID=2789284 RepID=UPI00397D8E25